METKISRSERFNQFRVMWVFVFFDLPTETKKDRKAAGDFRKKLLKDGFRMFQYSIYIRHCPSRENAEVHIKRTRQNRPDLGKVSILQITDKQYGNMEVFYGSKAIRTQPQWQQLELF